MHCSYMYFAMSIIIYVYLNKHALTGNTASRNNQLVCNFRAAPSSRPSSAVSGSREDVSGRAVPPRPSSAAHAGGGGRAVPARPTPSPGLTNALQAIGK